MDSAYPILSEVEDIAVDVERRMQVGERDRDVVAGESDGFQQNKSKFGRREVFLVVAHYLRQFRIIFATERDGRKVWSKYAVGVAVNLLRGHFKQHVA